MTIVHNRQIANQIFEMTFTGELVSKMTEPGQFLHIRVGDQVIPLLRRPISICDVDLEEKRCTILYRAEGEGTKLLSNKRVGDSLDVLGPLGNGFPLHSVVEGETAILIGGGIGIPPLYYLSKQLVQRNVRVKHILGFATRKDAFYVNKFEQLGETAVTTIDGSLGYQGFVTDYVNHENPAFDVLFTCGPTQMMKAIEEQMNPNRGYYSFEERMGCGIGACFACVCPVKNDSTGHEYRKVCSDGPVFPQGVIQL
ncbi:dihydroorotate dehydrogenase electron transfer subunit [Pseudalkalibacillus berkeleyi]|uniref:Dihydroorotate dehydrogenase B (NAD(+)), electron transfer subunit n=1 Tax=Pseudalkalibacillus berkeleyi TaxID=1069813 RepID=A0ABS9GYZ8_9BACL|nr:dihydroorotate dehydrogenase electron transfer subunit [Pseudalkalibacillus berkeleyi]MCF6137041.1 dihydroorotate dehydrogenase electron transfer subunit [Pseudalkalibacillus berkeleyi]